MKTKILYTLMVNCLFFSPIFAQMHQVTAMNGYVVEAPKLDIQGNSARISFSTNFYCYVFPVEGPSTPISNPYIPDPSSYGPVHVDIAGADNNIFLLYTDYTGHGTYYLNYVTSSNAGSTWSTPQVVDTVSNYSFIMTTYTNQTMKRSASGYVYAVWRNQIDTNRIYLAKAYNGVFMGEKRRILGDTETIVKSYSLELLQIQGNDNLWITYAQDSSLYIIRSTNGGTTVSQPVKVDSLNGLFSYFYSPEVVGSSNGTLYIVASFWQMMNHEIGGDWNPDDMWGTRLYRSTDFGSSWSMVSKIPGDSFNGTILHTSSGVLVLLRTIDGNIYLQTSYNGIQWSDSIKVNSVDSTAVGYYGMGLDAKMIGNTTIAVAWIDKSTGHDEIFYRTLTIPEPPVTVVERGSLSHPVQALLLNNYPNPFNPSTTFWFSLPQSSDVSLVLYDFLGREVATITKGYYHSGDHRVDFNGSHLPSGMYFARLTTETSARVLKVVLMK